MAENSKPEMMFLMLEEMGLVVVVMSKVKGLVVVMVMVLFVAMIVMGGRIRSVDGVLRCLMMNRVLLLTRGTYRDHM